LAGIETEIARIDEKLALANQPLDLAFSLESLRDFVSEKVIDFTAAFASEPTLGKEILARHIDRLVLTPREQEGCMVYEVSGDIDLFGGDGKAMSLVVGAYTGRSSKRRHIGAANTAQYASGQEHAMAFDPVSGHHLHYTLLPARFACFTSDFCGAKGTRSHAAPWQVRGEPSVRPRCHCSAGLRS
jgi:hypothetical protein